MIEQEIHARMRRFFRAIADFGLHAVRILESVEVLRLGRADPQERAAMHFQFLDLHKKTQRGGCDFSRQYALIEDR